jgi:hypothetical protein
MSLVREMMSRASTAPWSKLKRLKQLEARDDGA